MDKFSLDTFQHTVDDVLLRHRSALDILTKLQESTSRVNRAVAKSITYCGCVKMNAEKQEIPRDASFSQLKEYMQNHLEGNLCEVCRDKIHHEISTNFFYITALCNLLTIDMDDMLTDYHQNHLNTLGKYGLL
ncbi:MAG: DUF1573 domain-containing protein [Clostridiaceae bacterium]|nr:DUF1573 domain-containing protein [Clostridiaceae bacterium]